MILGIWDGHDAGAALLERGKIVFAINEERLSRRKLEIGFPARSIAEIIRRCNLDPAKISQVIFSTSDFSKTLSRVFPSIQEDYYQIRRRKKAPGSFSHFKKRLKYRITEIPPFGITRSISRSVILKKLKELGINGAQVSCVDHHLAHAACAAFCSGFSECAVLTIDGIGDGASGGVWSFQGGKLTPISRISGKHSLGIFFEHVTNLLNMRELEDEGKVMALANFAAPISDSENELAKLIEVNGLKVRVNYSSARLFKELEKILWRYPSEQFAFMAQRTLELKVVELARNTLRETKMRQLAYAGGVASNVKVNLLISELDELEKFYVFPHMGDGGLAVGAALLGAHKLASSLETPLEEIYLGGEFSSQELRNSAAQITGLKVSELGDDWSRVADLIFQGEIIPWFSGRMELGPRALGARSILCRPDNIDLKDRLNLLLKKRSWYQPFCPSILEEDSREVFSTEAKDSSRFMTCAYRIKSEFKSKLIGVSNIDGTCRPQIIASNDNSSFAKLLRAYKKINELGILLNTSFNIHGEPIAYTPQDALRMFMLMDLRYMVMGNLLVFK